MIIDLIMTLLLIVLMGYHITGIFLHEIFGVIMCLLFALHHVVNRKWFSMLLKGKHPLNRILVIVVNILLLITMFALMISGIMVSRDIFGFLNLKVGWIGRRIHMQAAAWGYILMSIHLGLHLGIISKYCMQMIPLKASLSKFTRNLMIFLFLYYGVHSFIYQRLMDKLFLLVEYSVFNYDELPVLFFLDYISIMFVFAVLAYSLLQMTKKRRS